MQYESRISRYLEEMNALRLERHLKKFAVADVKKTFEENFGLLTTAVVDERVPNLKPYDLGFQLVDKSDDNTQAFGVRGFKLRELVLMPFFFNNGKVGGYEMLYLPKNGVFVPATEQWVVYLLSRAEKTPGRPDNKAFSDFSRLSPNLLPLRRPLIFKQSNYFERAITKYGSLACKFLATIDRYPMLLDSFYKYYGPDIVDKAVTKAAEYYQRLKNIRPRKIPPETLEKAAAVRIYTPLSKDIDLLDLSPDEMEKMASRGYFIKDARDEEDKAEVQIIPGKLRLNFVTSPGRYTLVKTDGDTVDANIYEAEDELLVELDGKIVRSIDKGGGGMDVAKGMDRIHVRSSTLYPVYVTKISENPEPDLTPITEEEIVRLQKDHDKPVVERYHIYIVDKKGQAIQIHSPDRLYYNPDVSGIHIVRPKNYIELITVGRDCYLIRHEYGDESKSVDLLMIPQGAYDPWEVIVKGKDHKVVRASYVDGRYTIDGNILDTALDALSLLMRKYGFSEKDAGEFLKAAAATGKCKALCRLPEYLVKEAADPDLPAWIRQKENPAVSFYPEPTGTWPGGYPTRSNLEADVWIPGLKRPEPTRSFVEPPNPKTVQLLIQLSEHNSGEVFDIGALASLIYSTEDYSVINEFIPALFNGLSALGYLLFGMYRHEEMLRERYGDTDYKKLLGSLKTVFKNLGDLILGFFQDAVDEYLDSARQPGSVEGEALTQEE